MERVRQLLHMARCLLRVQRQSRQRHQFLQQRRTGRRPRRPPPGRARRSSLSLHSAHIQPPRRLRPSSDTHTRLRSLSILSLSRNSLSGAIPSFLSQIPSLTLLDLSNNKFTGCIPPELSALPILQSLILENNRLEGGVPVSFGNFSKSSPPNLFLAHNMLCGDIRTEFGVPDWVNLDLSHNKLCGDASFLFSEDKPINLINLSFNKFEFDMSMIKFSVSTWTLVVNNNMISGSIPAQINRLSNLVNFNVSYNRLCGIIQAGPVMDKFDGTHFYHNKCLCRSKDSCL